MTFFTLLHLWTMVDSPPVPNGTFGRGTTDPSNAYPVRPLWSHLDSNQGPFECESNVLTN